MNVRAALIGVAMLAAATSAAWGDNPFTASETALTTDLGPSTNPPSNADKNNASGASDNQNACLSQQNTSINGDLAQITGLSPCTEHAIANGIATEVASAEDQLSANSLPPNSTTDTENNPSNKPLVQEASINPVASQTGFAPAGLNGNLSKLGQILGVDLTHQ